MEKKEKTKIEEVKKFVVDPDIDDEHNLIAFWLNSEPEKPKMEK